MNVILAIPMEARLAALFVLGACVGSLANLGVYRLAWNRRAISPWLRRDAKGPARRWSDRLPVFGWLGLRRETALHGAGFWVRPMLVELFAGLGFAALYWWEIGEAGLLPPRFPRPLAPLNALHLEYAAHVALISLMLVASLIDVDEKTIPDAITVPGTLIGLALAAVFPWSLLPHVVLQFGLLPQVEFLRATSPNEWPAWLGGRPRPESLLLALAGFWLWCLAIMPWSWHPRRGYGRAMGLCAARLVREWATYAILVMGLTGSVAITAVWHRGGLNWQALFTALLGAIFGGGLIWSVSVIGTAVLHREAMGFGDVTLMAMIGAFLGWQTALAIFFLAPFAGLVVGLLQWIARGESEIPYGPFLCVAALASIVCWDPLWDRAQDIFALGWLVPTAMVVCLALMAVLLPMVRWGLSLLR